MNLKDMGALYDTQDAPPDCVLTEPLEQHLDNLNEFTSVVQALCFDSGPADNPTAKSYVFYFFLAEIDDNRRPDNILTFKVKLDNPFRVHIVDKYLGGTAFGAVNAPALAHRHLWRPGLMSEEGKQELMQALSKKRKESEDKKGGCFIATAVFDSEFSPEVQALKVFRDYVLIPSSLGNLFVKIYYTLSPPISNFLSGYDILKFFIRRYFFGPILKRIDVNKIRRRR